MRPIFILIIVMFIAGCSHIIYEQEKDATGLSDSGSKTEFQLRGPKAVIKHSF